VTEVGRERAGPILCKDLQTWCLSSREPQAMSRSRLRFTIRGLMIAVAVVAGILALLTTWRELLPVLILVGIPLSCLSGLLAQVPPQRPGWRFGILAAMLGLVILGGGWLWARSVISFFQRQEESVALGALSRAAHYRTLGLTIPSSVTAIGLAWNVLGLALLCAHRRRFDLWLLVVAYAMALAFAWICLFAGLDFEAF